MTSGRALALHWWLQ